MRHTGFPPRRRPLAGSLARLDAGSAASASSTMRTPPPPPAGRPVREAAGTRHTSKAPGRGDVVCTRHRLHGSRGGMGRGVAIRGERHRLFGSARGSPPISSRTDARPRSAWPDGPAGFQDAPHPPISGGVSYAIVCPLYGSKPDQGRRLRQGTKTRSRRSPSVPARCPAATRGSVTAGLLPGLRADRIPTASCSTPSSPIVPLLRF